MMTDIAGKNTLITGGAKGMGRLLALRVAASGGRVVIYDRNVVALEAVVEEIKQLTGNEAYGYVCDVSDRESVYATAEEVKEQVGPVDILVNNAGLVSGRSLLEIPDEKIESVIGVNVLALFWMTKAFLPGMIERGRGHIVTMASAAGLVGVSRQTDYSASKHAAIGFAESLRAELKKDGRDGIRTTIVSPFYVNTGMFEGVTTRFPRVLPILDQDKVVERVLRAIRRDEQDLKMPLLVKVAPVLRMLPVDVFDRLTNFFGINSSMDEFAAGREAD